MDTTYRLDYGAGSTLDIQLDPASLVADWRTSPCPSVPAEEAVRQALREPLDYPPLDQWTTPGDHIVLAVEEACPAAEHIVPVVVRELLRAGVEPADITLLRGPAQRASVPQSWLASLPADIGGALNIRQHDPHDEQQLAFLGVGADSQPIYLNRQLCEADLVVPIGSLKGHDSWGYWGIGGQLYPSFSDVTARKRHPSIPLSLTQRQRDQRRREAQDVLWLLGSAFTLQVVPAGGDQLLAAYAGSMEKVTQAGERLFNEAWSRPAVPSADLVIAGLTVGHDEEVWCNLARALMLSLSLVEDGGAIVLCTEWQHAPGSGLQLLAQAESPDTAGPALRRSRAADAPLAELLRSALERVRVLLYSRWSVNQVEQLGVGAITRPEQITKLAHQYSRCILLGHAQLTELSTPVAAL
ncbi:MAG: lactate racemase domain-containing protein [Pirellulales bacterium]